MATGPRYAVKFRRRREGRTDYKTRFALLKSGLPRLVVRKSNKYIYCQIINYGESGDAAILSATSNSLGKFGWNFSKKNLPAAYLTGLLVGKLAIEKGVKGVVLDLGLQSVTKGAALFAVLEGAIDAGLEVPHGPENLSSEERLCGKHLKADVGAVFREVKDKVLKAKFVELAKSENKTEKKKRVK